MKAYRSAGSRRGRKEVGIKKVSIVGAGTVGSTLGALLYKKGYEIVSIVNRSIKPAIAFGKVVRCKNVSTSVADIVPHTEMLLLAVADDALPDVVRECARHVYSKRLLVVHTSGVHSLDVLTPIQRKGAHVGSLHPIQSFPKTQNLRDRMKSVQGISFGIEGKGRALKTLKKLAGAFGGKSIMIPKGMKALYHIACVFASNYVVTLLNAVEEAAKSAGLGQRWRETFLPIFVTTVENALRSSPQYGLTGPIVRNDVRTIELHLDALQKFAPQLLPVYSVLGIETARLAKKNGSLTSEQVHSLVSTIRHHVSRYLEKQ